MSRRKVLVLLATLAVSVLGCGARVTAPARCLDGEPEAGPCPTAGGPEAEVGAHPPPPVPAAAPVVEIAVGDSHACARLEDGTVRCWGSNMAGELGDGCVLDSYQDRPAPEPVPGVTGVSGLALGHLQSCAILKSGGVRCWGERLQFETETGGLVTGASDVPVPYSGLSEVVRMALAPGHACALRTGGRLLCWGENALAAVGREDGEPVRDPSPVAEGLAVAEVAAGSTHTCVRTNDGAVACWGANDVGQLGTGDTRNRATPTEVVGLARATLVAASGTTTCAVLEDGTIRCWGGFACPPITDCLVPSSTQTTARPVPGLADVESIELGGRPALALRRDGSVWTFDVHSVLAEDPGGYVSMPTAPVAGLRRVVQVVAMDRHACVLTEDREVLCWGARYLEPSAGSEPAPTPIRFRQGG